MSTVESGAISDRLDIRLDPLKNRHCLRQNLICEDEVVERLISFDRNEVTIEGAGVPGGLVRCDVSEFGAVAARVVADDSDAGFRVVLELMHDDPMLSVPLAVASDLSDIVGDWRRWGAYFGLSLVFVEADGRVRPIERRLGAVVFGEARPRRRSVLNRRRPRFLACRKPGVVGEPVFVPGADLPARS